MTWWKNRSLGAAASMFLAIPFSPVTANAESKKSPGAGEITAAEAKILTSWAKKHPEWYPGVDTKTGEVTVTSADRKRQSEFQDSLTNEDDKGTGIHKEWARFTEGCEVKPKVIMDMAVTKSAGLPNQPDVGVIFEALWQACVNNGANPNAKAYIQKFKTIHFKLASEKCAAGPTGPGSHQLSFDPKTGEFVVGYSPDDCMDVVVETKKWVNSK